MSSLPAHKTVSVGSIGIHEWNIGVQRLEGRMKDGRSFSIEISGFDKPESNKIIAALRDAFPSIVQQAFCEHSTGE